MNRTFVLRALCAAAFIFTSAATARAAQPTPTPTSTPLKQIAHVVTSDRTDESATSAIRTTFVVTQAQMRREGDRTIADALANVPGVEIDRYGAFGAQTDLSLRGSSSAQVLVLLDGQPIAGSELGSVDLGQYTTEGVDRIEVVEGGGSTLYGSGSVGGVVNIITAQKPPSGALASFGSFGESSYALQTPYVSFSRTSAANGFSLPDATSRNNADGALTSLRGSFAHRIGALDASLTASFGDLYNGSPGSTAYGLSPTSRLSSLDRDLRLNLAHTGRRSTVTLQLGASSQNTAFTCDTPNDPTCPNEFYPLVPPATQYPPYADSLYDQHVTLSLRDALEAGTSRTIVGVDLERGTDRVDSGIPPAQDGLPQIVENPYAQAAAYAQSQWTIGSGSEVYAGLRGERDGAQGGAFSPSVGALLRLSPALAIRANAATAFDAPTALLLYYPGFANPRLQPERLRVGDVTLDAPDFLGGANLGWFVTDGSNLIVSNAPAYVPENVGRAIVEGFTLGVRTKPLRGYAASFDATDLYRAEDLATTLRLNGRGPVVRARLALDYLAPATSRFDGFGASATTKGAQGPIDPTQPAFTQPIGFTRLDAYLGFRVTPQMVLTLRGYDLGNERYAEFAGYPMPGRSFALELRTK